MTEQEAVRRLKQRDISGLEALVQKFQLPAIRAADLIVRDAAPRKPPWPIF